MQKGLFRISNIFYFFYKSIDKEKNENKLLRQQVSERENEISTLYYYNQNLTAKLNEKIA